jgi:hypothetical protein
MLAARSSTNAYHSAVECQGLLRGLLWGLLLVLQRGLLRSRHLGIHGRIKRTVRIGIESE